MKRARASNAKHKSSQLLYNKLTELVSLLSELTDIQELTDTIILQVRDIRTPSSGLAHLLVIIWQALHCLFKCDCIHCGILFLSFIKI